MGDDEHGHLLFPLNYLLEHVRGLLEHRYFLGYHTSLSSREAWITLLIQKLQMHTHSISAATK